MNYLLIGGAASISFVTILSRYREQGRDEEGEIALSVILNTMAIVLGSALFLAEFLTPFYIRIYSKGDPTQDALAVYMTRILLPGQLFFFAGGVLASVALVRKQFGYQAISPLRLFRGNHLRRRYRRTLAGNSIAGVGRAGGRGLRAVSRECSRRAARGRALAAGARSTQ